MGQHQTLSIGQLLPRPTFRDISNTMSTCFFIWFFSMPIYLYQLLLTLMLCHAIKQCPKKTK